MENLYTNILYVIKVFVNIFLDVLEPKILSVRDLLTYLPTDGRTQGIIGTASLFKKQ